MRSLAIIPARGGSKGVKDKNIRLVNGKPLIVYSIETAHESQLLTDAVVSTDSEKIAEEATKHGIEVIHRPSTLAQDDTSIIPVISHTLEQLDRPFDLIILLQPTSPIRTGEDIDKVIQMFMDDHDLEGVISVVPMDDIHPARMYKIDHDLRMDPLIKDHEQARRQDLPMVYFRNGCIYAVRTTTFVAKKSLMVNNKKAYIMPVDHLANVDNERDLIVTDTLIRLWKENKL